MHLLLDIFQGIGIAAAVGIRPFLPTLVVGALAAGDIQIDFKSTDYSFLQGSPFLIAIVVAAFVLAMLERRRSADRPGTDPVALGIAAFGLALGALLFAGALAQDHHAAWPGWIAGALCAAVGAAATGPLLGRVRRRLDAQAAAAVPLFGEGTAIVIALLSVLAPPVGLVALALLAWLWLAGRRREGRKYAGLRILR